MSGGQARVLCTSQHEGMFWAPNLEGSMDAFISTYVFDLLSDAEIADALTLAWRYVPPLPPRARLGLCCKRQTCA